MVLELANHGVLVVVVVAFEVFCGESRCVARGCATWHGPGRNWVRWFPACRHVGAGGTRSEGFGGEGEIERERGFAGREVRGAK